MNSVRVCRFVENPRLDREQFIGMPNRGLRSAAIVTAPVVGRSPGSIALVVQV
jgi:hypothetical protein